MKMPKSFHVLLAVLVSFASVVPAMAAPQGDETIAEVINVGNALFFSPLVEFRELILTVTGPCGFEYRQVVKDGEPYFKLDETTIDGVYTFNLTRHEKMDPAIVDLLQTARKRFDEETPKALCREGLMPQAPIVQSAGFLVDRAKIVYDPKLFDEGLAGGVQDRFDDPFAFANKAGDLTGDDQGPLTRDFVVNDDLIVDGSACIGFDCVNGESFSFDTIRLKENNLRIKFDDTSTAASFPSNDWQLTANASANGGASKFSIDDISGNRTPFTVEANARSHSLYVDDGGRIGNRTSTPSTEIHTIDGDTPTLRLQQDGSSGFAPQTWDVAGNETNFFIRDVSNGSTLPFRIRPGAPTSSIFIETTGDVGLGTASPDTALHISGANAPALRIENTSATAGTSEWEFKVNSVGSFAIDDVGDGAELIVTSDNQFRIVEQDTAPASCTRGALYTDTSGALCFCSASNSWTNVSGVGSCA